jgi:hypothetical protein
MFTLVMYGLFCEFRKLDVEFFIYRVCLYFLLPWCDCLMIHNRLLAEKVKFEKTAFLFLQTEIPISSKLRVTMLLVHGRNISR